MSSGLVLEYQASIEEILKNIEDLRLEQSDIVERYVELRRSQRDHECAESELVGFIFHHYRSIFDRFKDRWSDANELRGVISHQLRSLERLRISSGQWMPRVRVLGMLFELHCRHMIALIADTEASLSDAEITTLRAVFGCAGEMGYGPLMDGHSAAAASS